MNDYEDYVANFRVKVQYKSYDYGFYVRVPKPAKKSIESYDLGNNIWYCLEDLEKSAASDGKQLHDYLTDQKQRDNNFFNYIHPIYGADIRYLTYRLRQGHANRGSSSPDVENGVDIVEISPHEYPEYPSHMVERVPTEYRRRRIVEIAPPKYPNDIVQIAPRHR